MAEIQMERRPKRRAWGWLALLLVLAAAGLGAWYLFAGGEADFDTTPAAETRTPLTPDQEPPATFGDPAVTDTSASGDTLSGSIGGNTDGTAGDVPADTGGAPPR